LFILYYKIFGIYLYLCRKVLTHLEEKHCRIGFSPKYICPNCDDLPLPNKDLYVEHFKKVHKCDVNDLVPLRRKKKRNSRVNDSFLLQSISGLRNEHHKQCHILAALHLISQTDLSQLSSLCNNINCLEHPACLLHQFFLQYFQETPFYPHYIIENAFVFGVNSWPSNSLHLSRILRLFIDSAPKSLRNLFLTTIEWKFECQNCQRFVKAQNEDILLKLEAPEVKSLEHQLDSFLQTRKCTCGAKSPADFKIKRAGKWLLLEVDRTLEPTCGDKENEGSKVSLYSLKLNNTYNIQEHQYQLFATVNLNLDINEEGHFNVNFILNPEEVVTIHEDSIKQRYIEPSFDNNVMFVVLKKLCRDEESHKGTLVESESSSIKQQYESLETEKDISYDLSLLLGSQRTFNSSSASKQDSGCNNISDNENILKGDPKTVVFYKEKYEKKRQEEFITEANKTKYRGIKDIGDQILESKIYKIQSMFGSKKQRKKFGKLNSSVIDNDIKEKDAKNNVIDLCIPGGIGCLKD